MTPNSQVRDQRTGIVQEVLRSPGAPLEPAVRARVEARFGRDFGHVRLHTGNRAAASARALGARAYTAGAHIVFAKGRYNPGTRAGLWLLAHELAHVVQQGGDGSPPLLAVGGAGDPLEGAADQAADLVAAGRPVPPGFAFGSAPAGVIQCHDGPPCPGSPVAAVDAATVLLAHRTLESAYSISGGIQSVQAKAVLFGTTWANNVQVPQGAPNQPFARELLNSLLAWPVAHRPNIIDFMNRDAYFFRRVPAEPGVVSLINRFHALVHSIERRHNEPTWYSTTANWFPDHILEFHGDPLNRFICTEATEHAPARGLILYDIRQRERRQRRQQRALEFELWAFEPNYIELGPMVRAQLPKTIRFFDPGNSNYVIIAPQEFYKLDYIKQKAARDWENQKVQSEYSRNRIRPSTIPGLNPKNVATFIIAAAVVGSLMVVSAGTLITAPAAVAVTEGAAVSAEVAGIEVIIAYESGAAGAGAGAAVAGGTAAATAAEAATLAAYQAMLATPAAKALAATAGVVLVLGNVKNAQAAKPSIDQLTALKAVAVADFQPLAGGVQSASSTPNVNVFLTPEEAKGKFGLGTRVLYDGKPHFIIAVFSAK
jgi:hypothetical protein